MLFKLAAFAAIAATTVAGMATPTVQSQYAPINPPEEGLQSRTVAPNLSQIAARDWTNAKRLAAGLPLNPPHRRTQAAARSVPSSYPLMQRGEIIAISEDNEMVGRISQHWNNFGENKLEQSSGRANIMLFEVDRNDATTGTADIRTLNGPNAEFPFMGGITGFSSNSNNLKPGSASYATLGGTGQTPPNSPPVKAPNSFTTATSVERSIESAIFTVDPITGDITVQWVNEDLSTSPTYVGYTQNTLVLTGDKDLFTSSYGPTQWLTLRFATQFQQKRHITTRSLFDKGKLEA